jgi:hypothetical protein
MRENAAAAPALLHALSYLPAPIAHATRSDKRPSNRMVNSRRTRVRREFTIVLVFLLVFYFKCAAVRTALAAAATCSSRVQAGRGARQSRIGIHHRVYFNTAAVDVADLAAVRSVSRYRASPRAHALQPLGPRGGQPRPRGPKTAGKI